MFFEQTPPVRRCSLGCLPARSALCCRGCSASCPGRVCHCHPPTAHNPCLCRCHPHRPPTAPPPPADMLGGAVRRGALSDLWRGALSEPSGESALSTVFSKNAPHGPPPETGPVRSRVLGALRSSPRSPPLIDRNHRVPACRAQTHYRTGLVQGRAPLAAQLLLRRWPLAAPLVREGRAGPGRAGRALAGLWRPGHRSHRPCVGGGTGAELFPRGARWSSQERSSAAAPLSWAASSSQLCAPAAGWSCAHAPSGCLTSRLTSRLTSCVLLFDQLSPRPFPWLCVGRTGGGPRPHPPLGGGRFRCARVPRPPRTRNG
jgi:hypothetical protein